ncbi:pentatricopeptide repeat-containing protein At4g04370-like [Coffea arabica]|nr:pentatricopeptide repeat-containing protein At4g04370-like [Coffea arabica]
MNNKVRPHIFRTLMPPPPLQLPPSATATAATKSFNSKLNRLSSVGEPHQVLWTYISMLKSCVAPDSFTYSSLLKACTALNLQSQGLCFHQHVIVNGFSSDPYIATSLITLYSKLGHISSARKVFDAMPVRDIVPWTAIVGSYSRAGDIDSAFFMYKKMQYEGIKPSAVTVLNMLSGISESDQLKCLHPSVVKCGLEFNVALINGMLNVYGKCGRVEDARNLFELMNDKDLVSWNSLISVYALVGNMSEILELLDRMRISGMEPDQQTFTSLIPTIAKEDNIRLGKAVHGQILSAGLGSSAHVETALMGMYLKQSNVNDAHRIFDTAKEKDVVMWTTMISGLVQNERADKALEVFRLMLISGVMPSSATLASAIAACAQLVSYKLGTSLHGYIMRQNIAVDVPFQNALVTMYAKCGYLDQSFVVFQMMQERDVVSWNAIVAANAQNGKLREAFCLFNEMRTALIKPDSVSVVCLLQACASIGAYQQGKWIHTFVIRSCLGPCIRIDTALVDMYCKCGNLAIARKCFDNMPQHDIVSWSTIIAGYGSHGQGETALEMYSRCLRDGFKPNPTIFLSILYACSHNGLIDQGIRLFESMINDFRIEPEFEHNGCIVDLLCRAGRVEDAYDFYKKMFPEPMADVLGIILDACRTKRKTELADTVAKEISLLKPVDPGKYVQLAHNYASMADWDGVGEAWGQMKSLGLKKVPGWSFIELHGTIMTFFRGHVCHPQYDDVVLVTNNLSKEIRELLLSPNHEDFMVEVT